jgi:hypothetical protein
MPQLKRSVDEFEEECWQNMSATLQRHIGGRSRGDVEFFCVHGYLPETPIPGDPYYPSESWPTKKEHDRSVEGRSIEEREFFCVHGCWPERSVALGS